MNIFWRVLSPLPWLTLATVLTMSGVMDGTFGGSAVEEFFFVGAVLTASLRGILAWQRGEIVLSGIHLLALLLILCPLVTTAVSQNDFFILNDFGYRHFCKCLLLSAAWAVAATAEPGDKYRGYALDSLCAGYLGLAFTALYHYFVLCELDADTGRMALLFRDGDPNFLCLHMISGTAVLAWRLPSWEVLWARSSMRMAVRFLYWLSTLLLLWVAWLSASRGGIFALLLELSILMVVLPRGGRRLRHVLYLAGGGVLLLFCDGQRLASRLEFANDPATTGRLASLQAGLSGWLKAPIFGVGYGKAAELMHGFSVGARFVSTEGGITIHNMVLEVAAELGLVGIAVYGGLLLWVVYGIARAFSRSKSAHLRRAGSYDDMQRATIVLGWLLAAGLAIFWLPAAYNGTFLGTVLLLVWALNPKVKPAA